MTSAAYAVELSERALEVLKGLDKGVARRIRDKIWWLAQHTDTIAHEALKGEFAGLFRIRVGHYRVIYYVDHAARRIIVEFIGHRRDIYNA
jgi:mRNA interferase RelE/StbE